MARWRRSRAAPRLRDTGFTGSAVGINIFTGQDTPVRLEETVLCQANNIDVQHSENRTPPTNALPDGQEVHGSRLLGKIFYVFRKTRQKSVKILTLLIELMAGEHRHRPAKGRHYGCGTHFGRR